MPPNTPFGLALTDARTLTVSEGKVKHPGLQQVVILEFEAVQ